MKKKSEEMGEIEKLVLIESPEKESLGIKIDKTLIKQSARRIYGTIKEQIITDREETEELLKAIFGDVHDEVMKSIEDGNNH